MRTVTHGFLHTQALCTLSTLDSSKVVAHVSPYWDV